jgi:hypothetical protein
MKTPEWPGIATGVGILFILTLVYVGARDDFHLQEWQPLMASVIALSGAAVVYRGATLAYAAAMAKIEFDRELERRKEIRRDLGLCLRLSFALKVIAHESRALRKSIPKDFNMGADQTKQVKAAWFALREPDALIEAWNSLESFPPWIAQGLSEIRSSLYDMAQFKDVCGDTVWDLNVNDTIPPELRQVRSTAECLLQAAQKVHADTEKLIAELRA